MRLEYTELDQNLEQTLYYEVQHWQNTKIRKECTNHKESRRAIQRIFVLVSGTKIYRDYIDFFKFKGRKMDFVPSQTLVPWAIIYIQTL